jgi:hypothetical protein
VWFASNCVPGLKFYAFAIQSYRHVDKDGMDLMRDLARAASINRKVKYGGFLRVCNGRFMLRFKKGIMPFLVRKCSSAPVVVGMLVFPGC